MTTVLTPATIPRPINEFPEFRNKKKTCEQRRDELRRLYINLKDSRGPIVCSLDMVEMYKFCKSFTNAFEGVKKMQRRQKGILAIRTSRKMIEATINDIVEEEVQDLVDLLHTRSEIIISQDVTERTCLTTESVCSNIVPFSS